ncbi:regulatory protein RecX [Geomesophilobacter sediminis]|uniref:Regulatory protein RecX n=1 Tax=Geomesophilobacter sediminis TaxID=2798584 RepID=A0A8J7LWD4_9BACT|nr:regulatory protein RecX [Geomesophilobacter sediminis]MBJ6725605.1 regulatory protein RecX [Geomesophilobacter sediminis]
MSTTPFDAGLRLLALRDHSEAELRRKLKTKGYPADGIDGAVARLKELSYLDDLRFARIFAEGALRGGRYVGERLRRELKMRGVAESVIREALGELEEEFPAQETLAALIARRFSGFDPQAATDKEKRRVVSYLMRRGFALGAISKELKLNSTMI